MINGKLEEFVCNVAAKGRISYGGCPSVFIVDYLPGGISNREECGTADFRKYKARSRRPGLDAMVRLSCFRWGVYRQDRSTASIQAKKLLLADGSAALACCADH